MASEQDPREMLFAKIERLRASVIANGELADSPPGPLDRVQ
jgi:hypothetical protein